MKGAGAIFCVKFAMDPWPVLPIVRLFLTVAVLALIVFGSMLALTQLVEPEQRDVSIVVPPSTFNK